MKQIFADFFTQQEIQLTNRHSKLRALFENKRSSIFRDSNNINYKEISNNPTYSKLIGKIYLLSYRADVTGILAYYNEDDLFLWLDNHLDNSHFEEFIRRENLFTWLPDKATELAHLIVKTKLYYLDQPEIAHHAEQISRTVDDSHKELMLRTEEDHAVLLEKEQRLRQVADKIHPPTCVLSTDDETFQLDFCVWTRILGRVINIQCYVSVDGSFDYQGTQLTEAVGDWFVPR